MTAVTLYGIPNCDQVKKARAWMAAHQIDYTFHDFKKAGIERGLLDAWLQHLSWDKLINRQGTTWRGLPDDRKATLVGPDSAIELMLAAPSMIKRPVLALPGTVLVGFSEALYQQTFTK